MQSVKEFRMFDYANLHNEQTILKINKANENDDTFYMFKSIYINEIHRYRNMFSKGFKHKTISNFISYFNIGNLLYTDTFTNFASYMNVVDDVEYTNFLDSIYTKNVEYMKQCVQQYNNKLVDPVSIFDLELSGKYKWSYRTIQPPLTISNEATSDVIELYEMVFARDIPFINWIDDNNEINTDIQDILYDMNLIKNYNGPLINNIINVQCLFRSNNSGSLTGPYISQFLYYPIQTISMTIQQKYNVPVDTTNYLNQIDNYLLNWDGTLFNTLITMTNRYITTMRDGAFLVRNDDISQVFYNALSILQSLNVPFSVVSSRTKSYVSLGIMDIRDLMSRASKLAMDLCWMMKYTQMRMRPEEYGYQIHISSISSNRDSNIGIELLSHPVIEKMKTYNSENGGDECYLLPQCYPEGCGFSPSYPNEQSIIAGAMTTILKSFYNCDIILPNSFVASEDGTNLIDKKSKYSLTVGNELDKLASNIAFFRCFSGVNYRTDNVGLNIGEMIAIQLLEEFISRYQGSVVFTLKKRNGKIKKISKFN